MADNERLRKPTFQRRNPPTRPPPGVQKALHNFGVPDLRELINKKHQNQGESPRDKKPEPRVNLPPPDPSYNYLKDPARDRPRPPPPKREDTKNPQAEKQHGTSNIRNKHKPAQKEYIHPRYREQLENNNVQVHGERSSPQNSVQNREDAAAKKEIRFSEAPAIIEVEPQFPRGGRGGFRGRNPGGRGRGRGGRPREDRQEKIIENPVNIKVQLSTETGQRSCILDENTKIPDIKHVPDQIQHHRSPRGGFRGARSNFRGRKRGSFRGRGDISTRSDRNENSESLDNANDTEKANIDGDESNDSPNIKQEDNEEPYQEYEQESNENEEFVDSNENYEAEFSSEYKEDSPEAIKNLEENSLPESQTTTSFDPNLAETITITSSKYQDGEVKRSVEVKAGAGDGNDVGAAENGDNLEKKDGADEKIES